MQLWEGQSFIPCSQRREGKRVRKGQTARVSLGPDWAIWGAQGAGKGSGSPAVFITQHCWTQETHFASDWIALKKQWPFHLWGFYSRFTSVLHISVHWQQHWAHLCCWVTVQSLGSWDSLTAHPMQTHPKQSSHLCAGRSGLTWLHTLHGLSWGGAHVAQSVSVKSRGVRTAAWTSWASLLGGMRYKCVSERGAGFGGTDWNRSFLEANTSFHFCLPVFCQEAFAVSRSWWLQPAVLKLFYPQADCAV